MNSLIILFLFVPVLSAILLIANYLLSSNQPDSEKLDIYECGFRPILDQTREKFKIIFLSLCLAFLIFDMEIILIYPLAVSFSSIGIFGLFNALLFFIILTLGYMVEILSGSLTITNTK
jgi:NADH-ubiquinone oxidoreductase chain 3